MTILSFQETQKLLREYNFPWVETRALTTIGEANQFVREIGFPVVLKLYSTAVAHRTEQKAVIVNIRNQEVLQQAWQTLMPLLSQFPKSTLIMQPMEMGIELAAGMKRDKQFGPVIMFGLGGIFIEVFQDVSLRLAPFSRKVAKEMIKSLKGYPLLTGFRGAKVVNVKILESILVNLSRLSLEHPEIESIDFNPIMANGQRIYIVDAKFFKKVNFKDEKS